MTGIQKCRPYNRMQKHTRCLTSIILWLDKVVAKQQVTWWQCLHKETYCFVGVVSGPSDIALLRWHLQHIQRCVN